MDAVVNVAVFVVLAVALSPAAVAAATAINCESETHVKYTVFKMRDASVCMKQLHLEPRPSMQHLLPQ